MSEKRVPPLNNPPSEKRSSNDIYSCPYCEFTTKSIESIRVHKSKYHEQSLAVEGERVRERGSDKWERNRQFLLAHGYVKCPWWPVPCPTRINPLIARVCRHLNDCPA